MKGGYMRSQTADALQFRNQYWTERLFEEVEQNFSKKFHCNTFPELIISAENLADLKSMAYENGLKC